jgi:O-acetyl-ADP-ribose deacetylase (regulator of RNase III)
MTTLLDGRLIVITGDITRVKADAIVNAANSSLMGGGGVDGAIHRAGGPAILAECRALRQGNYPDGLPAGEAVETTAGSLPARYVIHTVGPVWHGGRSGEPQKLASCYRSTLELAARLGLESIAFPAISTGVYGYPREEAARVVWRAVSDFLASSGVPQTVSLVFYSEDDARLFLEAVPR